MQRVLPEAPAMTDFLDFSHRPDADTQAKKWMKERCRIPLDWRRALYDSVLIKLTPQRSVWYLNAHHMICDGWSFELIYRHMSEFYRASLEGRLPHHADLPAFAEYQVYERDYRDSSRHRKAEAYWTEVLAKPGEIANFYGKLPSHVTSRVRRISQELGSERTRNKSSGRPIAGGPSVGSLRRFCRGAGGLSVLPQWQRDLHDRGAIP